jgi:hypothetical protein
MTQLLTDCFGRIVRLTDERRRHVLDHPEMATMLDAIGEALRDPEIVRRSRSDPSAEMFYRFYARTRVGGKWLCVVVKVGDADAFVVTAYLTDKPKPGEDLWPRT